MENLPANSPLRDPSLDPDQDGSSLPPSSLKDPEDRQAPGEASERPQATKATIDVSGEMSDALADSGQEAGEDNRAFTAEETVLQQTSVEEPGSEQAERPAPLTPSPIPSVFFEQRDPPPPSARRDTDLIESSGETSDVVQDARQEHRLDDAAQHAEDHAPDG